MGENKVNQYHLGLDRDTNPNRFPEGRYSFQLNGINETPEGDMYAVATEQGTVHCLNFPTSPIEVGGFLGNEDFEGYPLYPWRPINNTSQSLVGSLTFLSTTVSPVEVIQTIQSANVISNGNFRVYYDIGVGEINSTWTAELQIDGRAPIPITSGTNQSNISGHVDFTMPEFNSFVQNVKLVVNVPAGQFVRARKIAVRKLETGPKMKLIGDIFMGDSWVVFLTDENGQSEIGLIKDCTYTTIVNNPCLNFNNQIQGEYRIVNGCERVIYWVDGENPDRTMNIDHVIDDPEDNEYITDGEFDCDLIKLKTDYDVACVSDVSINNSGGNLELGVYQVFLRYEDPNGNTTSVFYHSSQIPIVRGRYGGDYPDITGGTAQLFPATNKSISLTIEGLDQRFSYLEIIVGYTQNGSTDYIRTSKRVIAGSTMEHVISTLQTTEAVDLTAAELTIDTNPFDRSETIVQHDNRLIRGNVKGVVRDYAAFQKEALNAFSTYFWNRVPANNSADFSGAPKTSTYYVDNRSYMRDEIYSLGIVWVFKDGTTSPVFHIPGRKANIKANGDPNGMPNVDDPNLHNPYQGSMRPDFNTGYPGTDTLWDTSMIPATRVNGSVLPNFKHLNNSELVSLDDTLMRYVPRWKAFNTAYKYRPVRNTDGTHECDPTAIPQGPNQYWAAFWEPGDTCGGGDCAFWESEHRYPTTKDCDGNYIYETEEVNGETVGVKIRHHKMPDSLLEKHFSVDPDGSEYIHPLGLRIENINIPVGYENDVQGYYIVRERRTGVNKTILDKGIFYINPFFDLSVNGVRKEYSMQANVFNRHAFREGLGTEGIVGEGTSIDDGLVPMYSSVTEGNDAEDIGFRSSFGNNDAGLPNVVAFLQYDDTSQTFHSPRHKFRGEVLNPNHVFIEGKVIGEIDQLQKQHDDNCRKDNDSKYLRNRYTTTEYTNYQRFDNYVINRTIESFANLGPDEELEQGILRRHFLNNNQQEALIFESAQEDSWKNVTDFTEYVSSNDNSGNGRDGIQSGQTTTLYGSAKVENRFMYGPIGGGLYFKASECMHPATETDVMIHGGDIFISKFSFFKSSVNFFTTANDCNYKEKTDNDKKNDQWNPISLNKCLISHYVESEVNTELRHLDPNLSTDENVFWDNFDGTKLEFLRVDYNGNGGSTGTDLFPDDCSGAFGPWYCNTYAKNQYLYNEDYSKERDLKVFAPIQRNFDYCSDCLEEFPHRVVYSERAFAEQREDNYRVTLPNNYADIPPGTGDIDNLFVTFDELYCHTPRTLYKLFTKEQQLQSNQATIFVGTGEIFSIPPRELMSTDYGYAGSVDKWATLSTEYGTVFVDRFTGKVFILSDSLKEISNTGMRNWFKKNIALHWEEQYRDLFGTDLETDPAFENGAGFQAAYDPRHKRILLTKKDFSLLDPERIETEDDIDFSDPTLFEDKSWTLSYSFLTESWISWHSYKPQYYLNDANDFYSTDPEEVYSLYIHNHGDETTYYNQKRSWIMEYPVVAIVTSSPDSIHWISETKLYKEADDQYVDINDVTFDKALVYNTYQSTGKFDITVKTNAFTGVEWSNIDKLASRVNKNWYLSGLRDLSISDDEPPMTSDWNETSYQTEFLAEGYVDKSVNPSHIDVNKTPYQLGQLRDKYNYVRFFFKPEENYKKILYLSNAMNNSYMG